MNIRAILFLSILLAVCSCTVEKRLYTKGLHVEFRKPVQGSDSDHKNEVYSSSLTINPEKANTPVDTIQPEVLAYGQQYLQESPSVEFSSSPKIHPPVKRLPTQPTRKSPEKKKVHERVSIPSKLVTNLSNEKRYDSYYGRSFKDWQVFLVTLGAIAFVIGIIFLCTTFPVFAAVMEAILLILLILGALCLLLYLLFKDVHFEWFWSGR